MNEREKCKSLLDSFLSVVVDPVSPYSFSIARLYCLKGQLCETTKICIESCSSVQKYYLQGSNECLNECA